MSRISSKILVSVTISIATIIVVFVTFTEFRSHDKSLRLLKNQQKMITEGQAILLSQYMHEKNEDNIYLTLSGIVANPNIVAVEVLDKSGKSVFSIGDVERTSDHYVYGHAITYFENGKVSSLGEIRTYATGSLLFASMKERLLSLAVMVFLVIVAIVFAVAVTVRNVVEIPIKMLTNAFRSNENTQPEPLLWRKTDEMGFLISEFNTLNARVFQTVDGLRTELHENELLEAERFKCLAEATFEGIIIHQNNVVLDMNEAACSLLEIKSTQAIGKCICDVLTIDEHNCLELLYTVDNEPFQRTITTSSGSERTVELSCRQIEYGGKQAFVIAARDVTESIAAREKIEFLAHYDHLTRLANRFKFHLELHDGLQEAHRHKYSVSVLCLDLDGFKNVNDFNGHAIGDELLKRVASRLSSIVRSTDAVARLGGDEFAIAVFGIGDSYNPRALAKKIIREVSKPFTIDGLQLDVGVSIGIATCSEPLNGESDLLKKADMALYEAKRRGKGQYQIYKPILEDGRRRNAEIETRLRAALHNKALDVHFQPQAKLETMQIVGYEALVRWQDPVLGEVSPSEFISVAEQSGLIRELGQQVLSIACEAATSWSPHLRLAINLSSSEFSNPNLTNNVEEVLRTTGLAPHRLELEITETVIMHDENMAFESISRLKELGITIAIDDFGTGYSSLNVLQRYPFDRIKIDKSFIHKMDENPQSALIVRSIIGLSHSLNIGVIAEGVETEDDLRKLRMERCCEIQGYLLGKPEPNEMLMRRVQDSAAPTRIAS